MNTTPSAGNPSKKRAKLAIFFTLLFQLLRMFWVTVLALLFVVLYGLYLGWIEPKQWSDSFFYAAIAQILIASISVMGSTGEYSAASEVRYIAKGDVSHTRDELVEVAMNKMTFSMKVFIGSLLTFLISALVIWVSALFR